MTSNTTVTVNAPLFQQKQPEEIARQFLIEILDLKDLPNGSLQEVLKDGTILCQFIQCFAPNECITQDNIGQFLRKRMQSVVSCILAIKRIMFERKVMPARNKNTNIMSPFSEWQKKRNSSITAVDTKKSVTPSPQSTGGGYVKSQVQMITTNNLSVPEPVVVKVRRFSSSENTTNRMKYYTNMESNRKTSLKKMGSCAITVESDDGASAVYALGKSIGKGQFGEVFGGLNMDTGEYVAIKRIKRNQMECDDMNEVGVLKHLNSEHIVRYKGFSKDKEYLNIILEYVEMGSLRNNIKAFGKFPEKLAASYTYKILSGLHYLHSKDVIHCDLKAANILLTKTGGLKLTDFGVSLSLKMKDDENTGEPAGTPNWMAPEVIKFAGASAKSDIWSLGCTIVEMLTGKPPYAGMPSFAALYRIVEDEEPPIPKNIKLSEEATEFLMACFKKNPEDRPTAYELMKSKWMETYFKSDQSLLEIPSSEHAMKKSKSETNLECSADIHSESYMSNNNDNSLTHSFVNYQTYQEGEKCAGCSIHMKRLWAKSCQGMHLWKKERQTCSCFLY
ncbi:MAG: kinase-like domain-containing protein [Benjaminiella poitrasii]|nr:MAG: kinase-like domain-containing protein [Benjaminiella poitrasii]